MLPARTNEFFEKALPVGLIIAVFLLGFIARSPLIPALLWSVFISVAVFPFYTRLCARIGGRRALATTISAITLDGRKMMSERATLIDRITVQISELDDEIDKLRAKVAEASDDTAGKP